MAHNDHVTIMSTSFSSNMLESLTLWPNAQEKWANKQASVRAGAKNWVSFMQSDFLFSTLSGQHVSFRSISRHMLCCGATTSVLVFIDNNKTIIIVPYPIMCTFIHLISGYLTWWSPTVFKALTKKKFVSIFLTFRIQMV